MNKLLLLMLTTMHQLSYAHHNKDHVVIEIDPTLLPPESNTHLWVIFGPMVILFVFGLIKAIQRYRRER